MVTVGLKCEGFRVEMIIRSILTGSAWREYKNGCRELCGVKLPDGMKENERFPEPIITPTTKADEGHDMNISKEEIIAQGIVSAEDYAIMEDYTRKIFARGQMIAEKRGLILVDTKYEFGKRDGKVYLIDEIHTPDSSRYFYADGYEEKLAKGEPQRQLSKEFVRQWLIEHDFMNEPGQVMPEITDEYAESVSDRYIELYEHIVGEKFDKATEEGDIAQRIEKNVTKHNRWRRCSTTLPLPMTHSITDFPGTSTRGGDVRPSSSWSPLLPRPSSTWQQAQATLLYRPVRCWTAYMSQASTSAKV